MKKLFVLFLVLSITFTMMAERVDKGVALNVAKTIIPTSEFKDLGPMTDFNNFYIFSDDNSFVIVAADDRSTPILGYSNEFPFVVENMPSNINDWLLSLNEEIQYAIDNDIPASDDIRYDWDCLKRGVKPAPKNRESLEPIVATHWDQGAPYNNMCPGGSVTGCVATAMAQLMKYWEWPRQGEGSHSYYEDNYGNLYVNFANTIYDWDNMVDMPTTASPQAQQDAVATLMYHCGVSVDMDYSPQSSGAVTAYVADALVDYFDYNSNLSIEYREDYSSSQWKNLLKSELNAGRALIYRGRSTNSGHCFICDGYDNSDNFHFNWGWSGYCDGYYAIGALNPGQGGTGSGQGTYNLDNFIIKNVQPNTPSINAPDNLTATVVDKNVTLTWSSVNNAHHYKVYRDGFVIDDNVSGTSFTDNDVSYGTHRYFVKSVKSDGNYSVMSDVIEIEVSFAGPIPTNVTASQSGTNNAVISWTAPASETAVLKYGDGQPSGYSYGASYNFYWGQRFTSEQLSDYAGMAITSFQTYLHTNGSYTLLIYKEVSGELQQLVSQTFSHNGGGSWKTVSLNNPLVIDYSQNLIVALHNTTIEYPAPYMEYSGSGNAGLYSTNGTSFSPIDGVSWLFKTNITDGTYTYNIYRDGDQIYSNITQTTYTDQNLSYGTYEYTVRTNYYGGLSNPSEPASVTIVEPEEFSVTLSMNPDNAGIVTGEGTYLDGTTVNINAIANVGYMFDSWKENGSTLSTNASYSFVIHEDHNILANFVDNDLSVSITDVEDPSCNGEENGNVTIAANGGVPPYTYRLGNLTYNTSNTSYTFENIGAGIYDVKLEDATEYEVTTSVELNEPEGMTVGEIASGEEEICEGESASLILSLEDATTGQTNVIYRWKRNGSVISDSNSNQYTPTTLDIGTNTFTREVKDACEDWTASEGEWIVIVYEMPELEISGNTDIIIGESTTLTASGAETYLWSTGETTASITVSPMEMTEYSVVGTNGSDCTSETSVTIYVQPDAISENISDNVSVYLNPTNEKIYIESDGIKNITLISSTGQVVGYQDINDNNAVIDMQQYPYSIYILLISKNDGSMVRKKIVYSR